MNRSSSTPRTAGATAIPGAAAAATPPGPVIRAVLAPHEPVAPAHLRSLTARRRDYFEADIYFASYRPPPPKRRTVEQPVQELRREFVEPESARHCTGEAAVADRTPRPNEATGRHGPNHVDVLYLVDGE